MRSNTLDDEALDLLDKYWDSKPYWVFCIVFGCSKNTVYRAARSRGLLKRKTIAGCKSNKRKRVGTLDDDLALASEAGLSYGKWRAQKERGAFW